MKILIVTQYFFPEVFRINDLCKELKARGHEVVVLTGKPNYPGGKILPGYKGFSRWNDSFEGAEVLRVPVLARGNGGKIRLILNYVSFVVSASLLGLPRLIGRRFDVCLVFATSPITAALPANLYRIFTRCPLAIWIQDLWPEVVTSVGMVRSPWLIARIGALVKWIYRHADKLFLQSESFRGSVTKWGAQAEQIEFVPNWAESHYQPHASGPASDRFRILFAGNIGRAQGLESILAAIEILKNENAPIDWHFMGDGSLKSWLEEQISQRELSTQVKVLASQPTQAMPQIFSQYSALLASLGNDVLLSLVLPSKIQSSMACAMPILACGEGEMARVVVAAQCGLVSAPADARALAENALRLSRLSLHELRALGESGRKYCETHYDRNRTINDICNIFEAMRKKAAPS